MTKDSLVTKEGMTRDDLTPKGMASLAEWLSYCEKIGWLPEQLPKLERIWLRFKDKNGDLR